YPELQSAGARYQCAEYIRHNHQHGQHGADGGAGSQVLFLSERFCSRVLGVGYGIRPHRRSHKGVAMLRPALLSLSLGLFLTTSAWAQLASQTALVGTI